MQESSLSLLKMAYTRDQVRVKCDHAFNAAEALNFNNHKLDGLDLRKMEFSFYKTIEVEGTKTDTLYAASFHKSSLTATDFSECMLFNADFSGAHLAKARFNSANIFNSKFSQAVCSFTSFRGIGIATGSQITKIDMKVFKEIRVICEQFSLFKNKPLSYSYPNANKFPHHIVKMLNGSDNLAGANLDYSKASLKGADFSGALLISPIFHKANLKGAVFQNTVLFAPDFSEADLSFADFTGARVFYFRHEKAIMNYTNFDNALMCFPLKKEKDFIEKKNKSHLSLFNTEFIFDKKISEKDFKFSFSNKAAQASIIFEKLIDGRIVIGKINMIALNGEALLIWKDLVKNPKHELYTIMKTIISDLYGICKLPKNELKKLYDYCQSHSGNMKKFIQKYLDLIKYLNRRKLYEETIRRAIVLKYPKITPLHNVLNDIIRASPTPQESLFKGVGKGKP